MAYQTGTATSQEDLMNLLQTFAVSQGWTLDIMSTTNDWMAINNGTVYVQFRWDNTNNIAGFQSLGFVNTSTAPGNHTDDSGNGTVDASAPYNATVSTGRRINQIGNGPFTSYHFFTDGTTKYIHVVLEYSPGLYRHFSFGTLDKVGTWTGGEYLVMHYWEQSSNIANPSGTSHMFLWEEVSDTTFAERGTLHMESVTGQPVSSKWAVFGGTGTTNSGTDRAGNSRFRVAGGTRNGVMIQQFGFVPANLIHGFQPLIPIPIWWVRTATSPSEARLMGYAPGVSMLQIQNLSPGQELPLGGDTWKVFPVTRKRNAGSTEESDNMGIAYRMVA